MKKTLLTLVGIFAILGLVSTGWADTKEKPFDWNACKTEVEKYCKDVKGEEKIYSCLEEHDKDLTEKCEASHAKYEEMTGKKKAK